jgi:hypothetical protein
LRTARTRADIEKISCIEEAAASQGHAAIDIGVMGVDCTGIFHSQKRWSLHQKLIGEAIGATVHFPGVISAFYPSIVICKVTVAKLNRSRITGNENGAICTPWYTAIPAISFIKIFRTKDVITIPGPVDGIR